MIHLKKYILTLVALLAVTTQAWAGDTYKIVTTMTFNTWPPNTPIVKEAAASLPYTKKLIDWVETGENNAESIRNINVTGENIAKGTGTGWNTEITVNGAGTGNISFDLVSNSYSVTVTVTKNPTATPIPVAWDADTKTGTIAAMPVGNVIVNAEYYQDAAFAMSTGTTPVALAPTANNSAKANTDDPLVTGGEVANIVEGTEALEAKQGTLMYYFDKTKATTLMTAAQLEALTADEWSDKVPTADGLHFDAATDVFVYYYIKGADDVAGLADGVKHTFSDSDPVCLTVSVQKEPTFKVELNAEGLTTAEAANWKAAKGSATPAAFPLTGVKKDDNVTVTYTGSRKVIGLKAEKKPAAPTSYTIEAGNDIKSTNVTTFPFQFTHLNHNTMFGMTAEVVGGDGKVSATVNEMNGCVNITVTGAFDTDAIVYVMEQGKTKEDATWSFPVICMGNK